MLSFILGAILVGLTLLNTTLTALLWFRPSNGGAPEQPSSAVQAPADPPLEDAGLQIPYPDLETPDVSSQTVASGTAGLHLALVALVVL